LVFPQGQALDYNYPIVATLFSWPTLIALSGIIVLLIVAAIGRDKYPRLSFGIFWFFLALAVESTIIPLDPVFEHRLYIPMFGFGLVTMACIAKLPARVALSLAGVIIVILAILTWQRNALWNDPVAFYKSNLQSAPRSERVYLQFGNALMNTGREAEAQQAYEKGLAINPDYILLYLGLAKSFVHSNEHQRAVALLKKAIALDPGNDDLYVNLGGTYIIMKRYDQAIDILQEALKLTRENPNIYSNLGVAYEQTGRLKEAIDYFERAIQLDASNPQRNFLLGVALSRHGEFGKALQAYLRALELEPDHEKALFYAALASHQTGNAPLTLRLGEKLGKLNPGLAKELERITGRSTKSSVQKEQQ